MRQDAPSGLTRAGLCRCAPRDSFVEAGLPSTGSTLYGAASRSSTAGPPNDDVTNERLLAALRGGPRDVRSGRGRPHGCRRVFVGVPTLITTSSTRTWPLPPPVETDPWRDPGGPADLPSVDDLPGHHDRPLPRGHRAKRLGPARTSTSPSRRNGEPRRPGSGQQGDPASGRGGDPDRTLARRRPCGPSTTTSSTLSSPDAAELAKLLENVFRNVNIAFVNQLALLCERMGLDVWEVIDAAATKPFGSRGSRRARGSAGTASRSIRTTFLARPEFDSSTASSSSPATSTSPCRGTSSTSSPKPSTTAAGPQGGQGRRPGRGFKPNVRDARNSPAADVIAGSRARRRRPLPRSARRDVPDVRGQAPRHRARRRPRGERGRRGRNRPSARSTWAGCSDGLGSSIDTVNSSTGRARSGPSARSSRLRGRLERRPERSRPRRPLWSGPDDRPQLLRGGPARPPRGKIARRAAGPSTCSALRAAAAPTTTEVDGVDVQRLDVQRHQGAGLGVYLREYLEFLLRAAVATRRAHRRRSVRPRPGPLAARFPRVRGAALRLAGMPVMLDLHEAMPEFFRSRFPGATNPPAPPAPVPGAAVDRDCRPGRSPSTRRCPTAALLSASRPTRSRS